MINLGEFEAKLVNIYPGLHVMPYDNCIELPDYRITGKSYSISAFNTRIDITFTNDSFTEDCRITVYLKVASDVQAYKTVINAMPLKQRGVQSASLLDANIVVVFANQEDGANFLFNLLTNVDLFTRGRMHEFKNIKVM